MKRQTVVLKEVSGSLSVYLSSVQSPAGGLFAGEVHCPEWGQSHWSSWGLGSLFPTDSLSCGLSESKHQRSVRHTVQINLPLNLSLLIINNKYARTFQPPFRWKNADKDAMIHTCNNGIFLFHQVSKRFLVVFQKMFSNLDSFSLKFKEKKHGLLCEFKSYIR